MSDKIFENYVLSPKDINKEFKPKTKYDKPWCYHKRLHYEAVAKMV